MIDISTQAYLFGNHPAFDIIRQSNSVTINNVTFPLAINDLDEAQKSLQANTLNFCDWESTDIIKGGDKYRLNLSRLLDLEQTEDKNVFIYKSHAHATNIIMFIFS